MEDVLETYQRRAIPDHPLQARVERALLQLTQIAPADFRLVWKIVLRHAPRVPQTPQIAGENLPQIHAGSRAVAQYVHLAVQNRIAAIRLNKERLPLTHSKGDSLAH